MNIIFKHQQCNICGNDDIQQIGIPSIPGKFIENRIKFPEISIVRCKYCGFYYTDPMPIEGITELYDSQYFKSRSTEWWQKARRELIPKVRFDVIQRHLKSLKPRFLEIGCGPGYGLEEAKRRNWQIYGQDVTDVFAKKIKEKLGVEIYVGELEQANFKEKFFDVVYLDSVIEHVSEPAKFLKEIRRIVKPDGLIYIVTPNVDALINRFRDLIFKILRMNKTSRLSPFESPYHIGGFTEYSFKLMCRKNGFGVRYLKICSGKNEWRKYAKQGWQIKARHLLYYPVYLFGEIIGRGITIEALISPKSLGN
jgi:SAM-dependent methyltransferase